MVRYQTIEGEWEGMIKYIKLIIVKPREQKKISNRREELIRYTTYLIRRSLGGNDGIHKIDVNEKDNS
jgi:hypothetical protein